MKKSNEGSVPHAAMRTNKILSAIKNRRSIRKYTNDDIPDKAIETMLEAGRWAPSGLNNQPWKFIIIKARDVKQRLSALTESGRIVQRCNACIAVFYFLPGGYNRDKDLLAIGACVQNMLLAAESLGIGTVWLGEILNRKTEVNKLLGVGGDCELMAVVALGYPAQSPKSSRKKLSNLVMKKI
jgi:nitroreductase